MTFFQFLAHAADVADAVLAVGVGGDEGAAALLFLGKVAHPVLQSEALAAISGVGEHLREGRNL